MLSFTHFSPDNSSKNPLILFDEPSYRLFVPKVLFPLIQERISHTLSSGGMSRPQYNFMPPSPSPLLKLPQEIRDRIYVHLLVVSWPIIIWAGNIEPTGRYFRPGLFSQHRLKTNDSAINNSRKGLSTEILRCSASINLEACGRLYGKNTFIFDGDHDWMPVIQWLHSIGICNSSFIRRLEISVVQPTMAWQSIDASRKLSGYGALRPRHCFPRNGHFSCTPPPFAEGMVENLNPAMEIVIGMLSRWESKTILPRLTLTFNLQYQLLPGVVILGTRQQDYPEDVTQSHYGARYFSVDMPNLIEKWRVEYTSSTPYRSIEVLWIARSERLRTDEKISALEAQGWEILETVDEMYSGEDARLYFPQDGSDETSCTRLKLRRRALTLPLIASEPMGYYIAE